MNRKPSSTWAGVIAGKTWTLEPITIASPILSAHRRSAPVSLESPRARPHLSTKPVAIIRLTEAATGREMTPDVRASPGVVAVGAFAPVSDSSSNP